MSAHKECKAMIRQYELHELQVVTALVQPLRAKHLLAQISDRHVHWHLFKALVARLINATGMQLQDIFSQL